MKQKNNILSALAPALLLCAAVFGMAGCTQGEDALQGAGATAQGGEPIHVSVAPKPGFIGGTDTTGGSSTGTRATVGDDGTFGWTENTDHIYIYITFNDELSTKLINSWRCEHDAVDDYYPTIKDWRPQHGWTASGDNTDGDEISWPLGASQAVVNAFYTDVPRSAVGGNEDNPTSLTLNYSAGGTGDHMIFTKTLTLGEALTLDFHHATTRLVFTGLKANTAYSLKAGGTALTFPTVLTVASFSLGTPTEQTFTSNADGKLVICAALDDKLNATTHKVSLEVMEGDASGTSVGTVELTARGSDADGWKMDGYMYTVNFANGSGAVNPDSNPDLLKPTPIVAGNKVYAVNGYYVTAPDANESNTYILNSSNYELSAGDPCKNHGNWRMPTMYDFQDMAGWTISNPWDSSISTGSSTGINSDASAWNAAFPVGEYWSSVVTGSGRCGIEVQNGNLVNYNNHNSAFANRIRCVQLK